MLIVVNVSLGSASLSFCCKNTIADNVLSMSKSYFRFAKAFVAFNLHKIWIILDAFQPSNAGIYGIQLAQIWIILAAFQPSNAGICGIQLAQNLVNSKVLHTFAIRTNY